MKLNMLASRAALAFAILAEPALVNPKLGKEVELSWAEGSLVAEPPSGY